MAGYLLPRHLGGTKLHPLQARPNEWYDEQNARRDQRNEASLLRSLQRQAEDRARRYQLQDEQRARGYQIQDEDRAFDRQVDLQEMQQDFDQSMQGDRYVYQSRLQGQGEQADLDRGAQEFGFRRALAGDEFRYDSLGRQEAGDIAAEAALMAFETDDALQDQRLQTQVGLAEFGAEQDLIRGEVQHGYDMAGREYDAGTTRVRDELLDFQNRRNAEQEQVWALGKELRARGYLIHDRDFNKDQAIEYLKIESRLRAKADNEAKQLERSGLRVDDMFKSEHVSYLRTQQQIEMGERFLPPNLQTQADRLRMEFGTIMTTDALTEPERNAELMQNRLDLFNVYRGAQETPIDQRIPSMEEDFGRNVLTVEGRRYTKNENNKWERMANDMDQKPVDAIDEATGLKKSEAISGFVDIETKKAELAKMFMDMTTVIYSQPDEYGEVHKIGEKPRFTEAQAQAMSDQYLRGATEAYRPSQMSLPVTPEWNGQPSGPVPPAALNSLQPPAPPVKFSPASRADAFWNPDAAVKAPAQPAPQPSPQPKVSAPPATFREAYGQYAANYEHPSAKKKKSMVSTWNSRLPKFASDAELDVAIESGKLKAGQYFIGPDGQRYKLQ